MNMKGFRAMAAALCAAVLLCGFAVPAYAETPEAPTDGGSGNASKPLTPDGTGTVVDTVTEEDGKEFFTIVTEDEAVFYLVIDRQRGAENVYFLNAVTVEDLAALAELPEGVGATPDTSTEPKPTEAPPVTDKEKPETGVNMGMILLALAVVVIGGGAAFYFKVYRPKRQKAAESEEDFGGELENYGDAEDYDEEDDGPPWDEESTGEEEEPT